MLDSGEARRRLAEGWQAADLHVHTHHSYDVIPTRHVDPWSLYLKARRHGLAYVAFTDHDTMAAYDQIGWTREGLVPAVEVKILDPKNVGHTIHVNVYALSRGQFWKIRDIAGKARDIVILIDYLRAERLPFVFNHPFWHEPEETPNLPAVLEVAELFPVLEYNMGRIGRLNAQAVRLADAKAKGIIAATDSHVGEIGRAFTLARSATFEEFFGQIAARRSFICPADLTLRRLKEETSLRIKHLFDKTGWLHAKESFTLETGNALLDGIIGRVAREKAKTPKFSHLVLKKTIEALSNSGVPGSLYLRYQNSLADRVSLLLNRAETAA